MKYLKLFENFRDIDSICRRYCIENYTINSDGSIDVNGDVDLFNEGLTNPGDASVYIIITRG